MLISRYLHDEAGINFSKMNRHQDEEVHGLSRKCKDFALRTVHQEYYLGVPKYGLFRELVLYRTLL